MSSIFDNEEKVRKYRVTFFCPIRPCSILNGRPRTFCFVNRLKTCKRAQNVDHFGTIHLYTLSVEWFKNCMGITSLSRLEYLNVDVINIAEHQTPVYSLCVHEIGYIHSCYSLKPRLCSAKIVLLVSTDQKRGRCPWNFYIFVISLQDINEI